jgi:single-strand DNA-binding protein
MSRSLNKVMLIGNVGNEPEIRATSAGSRVAKVSVATNRTFQDRTGQQQEKTEWHRLTFFGRLADIVEQYVKKGDRLYVEGRLEYSQTQDDSGNTRYWTDIVVNEMVMLGSGAGGGDAGGDFGGSGGARSSGGFGGGATSGGSQGGGGGAPLSEPDDDLPF